MGIDAIGAILDAFTGISEMTAALRSQCIQWTIAEQAIEGLIRNTLMTWKKFAVPVLKKFIMVHIFLPQDLCYHVSQR